MVLTLDPEKKVDWQYVSDPMNLLRKEELLVEFRKSFPTYNPSLAFGLLYLK
jgi:hypothetical protein